MEPRESRLDKRAGQVERPLAWLARFRRLTIRYECDADLHLAFLDHACTLIYFRLLKQQRL